MNVTFAPSATGGVTGSVTVTSNASNSPVSISLSGTGVPAHSATLNWTASTSTVIGYDVYRGTVSGGPYTLLTPSPITGDSVCRFQRDGGPDVLLRGHRSGLGQRTERRFQSGVGDHPNALMAKPKLGRGFPSSVPIMGKSFHLRRKREP